MTNTKATVKRFGDINTKAFPEVERHLKIDEVRGLGDVLVKDMSEPMKMKDDKTGEEKEVVIILAEDDKKSEFTFTAGGVVMEKIIFAKNEMLLPLPGKIQLQKGKNGRTYNDIV